MKDHFKYPYEIPAFNFYEAEKDLTFMLKGSRSVMLTDIEKMVLINTLIDLKEWFSVQYNKVAYKNNLGKMSQKVQLENKILAYNGMLIAVSPFKKMLLSDVLSVELLEQIKACCKGIKIPFIDYVDDFKLSVERYIKGATNDLNRISEDLKEKGTEFNYVRECIKVSKAVGVQVEPMKITLIEWVELLKLANE